MTATRGSVGVLAVVQDQNSPWGRFAGQLHLQERVTAYLEANGGIRAAIDGESTWLETPARCRIRPRALRVLVPATSPPVAIRASSPPR